jgi:hypothetical protein
VKITLATSCIVLAAFLAPIAAHAEYFCNPPPSQADKRACELAKLDRPDELRFFIHRTRAIYGLYMGNYVTEKDMERWDVARRSEEARSIEAKDDRKQIKSVSR